MANILIAGCGKLGLQLGQTLSQADHKVTGIRRSQIHAPFPLLQLDLSTAIDKAALPQQIDYVVYSVTPSERSDDGYKQAYVDCLNNLLVALKEKSVKRFFYISSTAVYHQDDGSWVDERSPTNPTAFNGVRVLEGEKLAQASNHDTTILRFGGIYGRSRSWLLSKVLAGCDMQVNPPKYTNRIHEQDCIGVIAFLINLCEQGEPLKDCYLAVDDEPASEEAIYSWLAQQLQARPPTAINPSNNAKQNKRCRNALIKEAGYVFQFKNFRLGYLPQIQARQQANTR